MDRTQTAYAKQSKLKLGMTNCAPNISYGTLES